MLTATKEDGTSAQYRLDDFPALAGLRLDVSDLNLLSNQGFVCKETRGNRSFLKLRFRRDGRQATRYIGGAELAADVQFELDRLQAALKLRRRLAAIRKEAKQTLQPAKRVLEPLLKTHGFKFHGRAIRQSRAKKMDHVG